MYKPGEFYINGYGHRILILSDKDRFWIKEVDHTVMALRLFDLEPVSYTYDGVWSTWANNKAGKKLGYDLLRLSLDQTSLCGYEANFIPALLCERHRRINKGKEDDTITT